MTDPLSSETITCPTCLGSGHINVECTVMAVRDQETLSIEPVTSKPPSSDHPATDSLVQQLRDPDNMVGVDIYVWELCAEAADALEAQAREIERLQREIKHWHASMLTYNRHYRAALEESK